MLFSSQIIVWDTETTGLPRFSNGQYKFPKLSEAAALWGADGRTCPSGSCRCQNGGKNHGRNSAAAVSLIEPAILRVFNQSSNNEAWGSKTHPTSKKVVGV